MTTAVAEKPTATIERDRYGRPLIIPQGGGKPIPYSRASSYGDVLEDRSNLEKWKLRMAVKGLAVRPDLFLAASATPLENKSALNKIADDAITAAGGDVAASVGTSLHSLTELLDAGETLPPYPAQYGNDLAAYIAATSRFRMDYIERFLVCDELQVAGTPDRILRMAGDDRLTIGDLKTGSSGGKWLAKHAVQLAIYAHSDFYDPQTGNRSPIPNVNQEFGVVFHAPAGQGKCDLYRLDLQKGWEAAKLAAVVRSHRKTTAQMVVDFV